MLQILKFCNIIGCSFRVLVDYIYGSKGKFIMNNDASVVTENFVEGTGLKIRRRFYHFVKRIFDIVLSFIGCLFLLPMALIIKIFNMLSGDFAPVIYSQNRIGLNGKEFKFYKFRSMIPNADEVLFKLLEEKYKEWNSGKKK